VEVIVQTPERLILHCAIRCALNP